jgi:hypothetical protein
MDQLDLFGPPVEPPASAAARRPAHDLSDNDPLPSRDLTPRQVLEQWLREQAIPYVDADNIKTGLPNRNRLQLFDFVVHQERASWLLAACHDNPSERLVADLREWGRILGPGFAAVVARVDDDGGLTLRTIDGERVDLR